MNNEKDIVPKLLEDFQKNVDEKRLHSDKVRKCLDKLTDKSATSMDINDFGLEMGKIFSSSLDETLTIDVLPNGRMYYNIGDRVLTDTLKEQHTMIVNYATDVQTLVNKKAGINIKGVPTEVNEDRIHGIVEKSCSVETFEDVKPLILDSVENFSMAVVDEFIRFNARFHQKCGLEPVIMRNSRGHCCEWCQKLVGIYKYEEVSDQGNPVFRRHRHCDCVIVYDPNNKTKGRNVHSRKDISTRDMERMHARILKSKTNVERNERLKRYEGLAGNIVRRPRILGAFEPATLKEELERNGYEVKPLGRGDLKGVKFENDGGYRINFGGDGYIQYHPEEGSHHGGEYYKISSGPEGTRWYDINGRLVKIKKVKEEKHG